MAEKLVRDRIPEIIKSSGKECKYRIADGSEYTKLLTDKLDEEVAEFKDARNLEELADVMEVLFSFAEYLGYTRDDLLKENARKREERGSFKTGAVLDMGN